MFTTVKENSVCNTEKSHFPFLAVPLNGSDYSDYVTTCPSTSTWNADKLDHSGKSPITTNTNQPTTNQPTTTTPKPESKGILGGIGNVLGGLFG